MRRLLSISLLLLVSLASSPAPGSTPAPLSLTPLVRGLRSPVAVVADPVVGALRLYVVEQRGTIRVVERGALLSRPFVDLRTRVLGGGLRGLLSLTFGPRYSRNGHVFVQYVSRAGSIEVARLVARRGFASASSLEVLVSVETAAHSLYSHYGGQLLVGPDNKLYASFGDDGVGANAQDPETLLGKLVRIDVSEPSPVPEVVATGLRNPWRFSFVPRGAGILIGDVGGGEREEIDYLPHSLVGRANFGWDAFEGTLRHHPLPPDHVGQLLAPVFEYPHTLKNRCYSVVGGYVYRGSRIPSLYGRYLFGDLCGGFWSGKLTGGRLRDVRSEQIPEFTSTLSSFGSDPSGEIYLVGYSDGAVYRLT